VDPRDFIKQIADAVAAKITSAPPKSFDVKRTALDGTVRTESVTLPQAIAALTDEMQLSNNLKAVEIESIKALIGMLDENRKIGNKILKQNRKLLKKRDDDDEDDDEE